MPPIRYIVSTHCTDKGVQFDYIDVDLPALLKEACMALGVKTEQIKISRIGEHEFVQLLYNPGNCKAIIVSVSEMPDSMRKTCKVVPGTEFVLFFKRGMLLIRPTTTHDLVEAFIKRVKEGRSTVTVGVLERPMIDTEHAVIEAGRKDNVDVRLIRMNGTREDEAECARLIRESDTPLNRRPGYMELAHLVRTCEMSAEMQKVLGIDDVGGGTHILFIRNAWIYLGAIFPYDTAVCFISDAKAGEYDGVKGYPLDKIYPPEASAGPAGRTLESTAACEYGLEGLTLDELYPPEAPAARARKTCAVCGKTAAEAGIPKLLHCSVCTIKPRYCSEACQLHAWNHGGHKAECRANRR